MMFSKPIRATNKISPQASNRICSKLSVSWRSVCSALEANENVSAVAAEQFSLYHLDEQYHPIGIETSITLGVSECFQIVGLNDRWIEVLRPAIATVGDTFAAY